MTANTLFVNLLTIFSLLLFIVVMMVAMTGECCLFLLTLKGN